MYLLTGKVVCGGDEVESVAYRVRPGEWTAACEVGVSSGSRVVHSHSSGAIQHYHEG